jgi:uncharacterized protein YhjY with autotransporter beta-barrel domain
MSPSQRHQSLALLLGVVWVGTVGISSSASAQSAFQTFLLDVCSGSPSGDLLARCAESSGAPLGAGDVSGDSEPTLNPTQGLAMNQSALARAFASVDETEERLEALRDERGREIGARFSLLADGRWETVNRSETARERGWDGDKWSTRFGADYVLSDRAVFGGVVSLDWADYEFDRDIPTNGLNFTARPDAGDSEAESYAITVFGSYNFTDSVWADAHVGGGYTEYEFRRRAVFQEANRGVPQTNVDAKADSEGGEFETGFGVGYDGHWGGFSGGGYVRGNYVWTRVDGFREKGSSGLEMRVEDETQQSFVSVVGLRGAYAISTPIGVLLPQARVEWEHEYLRDRQSINTSYVQDTAGTPFKVEGNAPDRDYGNAGASISLVLQGGWIPFVDYEALFGHSYLERHRVTAGFRKEL